MSIKRSKSLFSSALAVQEETVEGTAEPIETPKPRVTYDTRVVKRSRIGDAPPDEVAPEAADLEKMQAELRQLMALAKESIGPYSSPEEAEAHGYPRGPLVPAVAPEKEEQRRGILRSKLAAAQKMVDDDDAPGHVYVRRSFSPGQTRNVICLFTAGELEEIICALESHRQLFSMALKWPADRCEPLMAERSGLPGWRGMIEYLVACADEVGIRLPRMKSPPNVV